MVYGNKNLLILQLHNLSYHE